MIHKGKNKITLLRTIDLQGKKCEVELGCTILSTPPMLGLALRLKNMAREPMEIPIILGIINNGQPLIRLGGDLLSTSSHHALGKDLIRIKKNQKRVAIEYLNADLTFSLLSDIQPQTLIVPPRPEEGKHLEIRYGAARLEVNAEKRYNLWVFMEPLNLSLR